jgi:hypothetical protein
MAPVTISVSVNPGAMQNARTPSAAKPRAIVLVIRRFADVEG